MASFHLDADTSIFILPTSPGFTGRGFPRTLRSRSPGGPSVPDWEPPEFEAAGPPEDGRSELSRRALKEAFRAFHFDGFGIHPKLRAGRARKFLEGYFYDV